MTDKFKRLTTEDYADSILNEIEQEASSIDLHECESLDEHLDELDYDPDDEYYNEMMASGEYTCPFESDEYLDEMSDYDVDF